MDTKAAEKLRVLEIPYRNLKRTLYRREFDDYKLCGTYYKAGIPFEVTQVTYPEEDYPKGYGEFYPKEPTAYSIAYGALNSQICAAAKTAFQAGEMVLLTGGGCDHIIGVLGGLQKAIGLDKRIGFIWLDAHGDFNTPDISLSGRPGGVCLAVCAGKCCDEWRLGAGLEQPIPTADIILSDARNLDPLEEELIRSTDMVVVDTDHFNDPAAWDKTIAELAQRVDAIVLHIDQDILDAKYIPNSFTPVSSGPEIETTMRNIKTVMETGKVIAYALVSVTFINNKPGQDERTINAMRLLGAGLESWKACPDIRS